MRVPQQTESRLFTGSLPSLDLSTILFVVIVEAAFILGITPLTQTDHYVLLSGLITRDHLSYLFLQPVHSTFGDFYSQDQYHQSGGEKIENVYDYYSDYTDYNQPYNQEEFVYSYS